MDFIALPDRDRKGYRLKCRFVIEAKPTREHLKRGAIKALELFVRDAAKQGWEYEPKYGPRLKGPFAPVVPMNIHRVRQPSSRDMLPEVRQGARFLAGPETIAQPVPSLDAVDHWEYELAVVFARKTILFEVPDPHEEREVLRTR